MALCRVITRHTAIFPKRPDMNITTKMMVSGMAVSMGKWGEPICSRNHIVILSSCDKFAIAMEMDFTESS